MTTTTTATNDATKTLPSVHLQTYGCQMNEYDTELVKTLLGKCGYPVTKDEQAASVVLINTCAVRETAHTKIHARLGDLTARKQRSRKGPIIGVLGCMSQNLKDEMLAEFPAVDFICGPDSYRDLPGLIDQAVRGERGASVELSEYETYEDIAPSRVEGVNAWIAIMRGCDKFCTFCVVPYTRGRERSRDPQGIVDETKRLVDAGYKQVTLLGQNVNSYRHGEADFAELMDRVAGVEGIERVRFTSPHPRDFPMHLLEVIAANPKLCKQIHLPLQAGSDRILRKMNRKYKKAEFIELAHRIRETIPDVAFSTDIICGFPSETDEEYQDTVDVVREVQFDSAFVFKYSERKGTVASKMHADDIPESVKSDRVTKLVAVQREISLERNQRFVGRTMPVLIEGTSKKSPDQWRARTDHNIIAVFRDPRYAVGDLVPVHVREATPNTLISDPA